MNRIQGPVKIAGHVKALVTLVKRSNFHQLKVLLDSKPVPNALTLLILSGNEIAAPRS